jgi:hypothetical protein
MLILTVRRHVFLCLPPDLDGVHDFIVLGATLVDDGVAGVSAMVRAQLSILLDDETWSRRLPTATTNVSPDLLDSEAVKEAYRSAVRDPLVWEGLIADLPELRSVRTAAPRRVGAAPSSVHCRDVNDGDRERLFDEWFVLTYRVREQ